MSIWHITGMAIIIILIVGLAVYSGSQGKAGSKGSSAGVVAGVIMGTLVGGSSTIGTAQLAYHYGMSAWWFTLGGGIGCLIQALIFCGPIRRAGNPTLVGIVREEYGSATGFTASILSTVGTFINIISQILAASAVVMMIWPEMPTLFTVLIAAVFMVLYVIFGGTKGAGMVGILKLLLLYASMVICGVTALSMAGGMVPFLDMVRSFCQETGVHFFSPIARGAGKDLGAGLSLVFGVLTTQTYAQGLISAKDDRAARTGGLISAFLIPPIGIFGIIVGLYMRSVTDPAVFTAKAALTKFVLDYMPPMLGGAMLGALFIASVGTGAGLALGISSMLTNDVIIKFTRKFDDPRSENALGKLLIVAVLATACLLSTGSLGDIILGFAFMSMGLRGAVVFAPLCCALWLKGKVPSGFAMAAVIAGPVAVVIGNVVKVPIDPLFIGIIAAFIIMLAGLMINGKQKTDHGR